MRKLLVLIGCLMAYPAVAADAFKAPVYQRSNPWTYNWIGIQGGYAGQGDLNNPFVNFSHDGYFGGINMGTQRQFGSWVWGLELEGNYARLDGSTNLFGVVGVSHEVEAFGSLRARLGYTSGAWHLYGLGGVAMASTNASISVPGFSASDSKTHIGWVGGIGLEYAMASNWVLGAEWSYYNFGSENYGFAVAGPIGLITPVDFDFHTVKAKAAYRW